MPVLSKTSLSKIGVLQKTLLFRFAALRWRCVASCLFFGFFLIATPNSALAHGGVAIGDDDLCLINIDFLRAHFTIYQPQSSGAKEFCEDIPQVGESVFVMKYEHEFLREMPVDFRIIRNVTDVGFYAQWGDVEKLGALESITEFYQTAEINPEGVFSVNHTFADEGMYIGIVSATHPQQGKIYRAVFPFQVGGRDWGYLPLFVVLLIVVQVVYWQVNRRLRSGPRQHQH